MEKSLDILKQNLYFKINKIIIKVKTIKIQKSKEIINYSYFFLSLFDYFESNILMFEDYVFLMIFNCENSLNYLKDFASFLFSLTFHCYYYLSSIQKFPHHYLQI